MTNAPARRMYEGAGLGPKDVDIFNPYDGYAPMAQFFLEAFQWHGVERGDAFASYAGDISVDGPHPFCSMPETGSPFATLLGQIAKYDLQLPSSGANLRREIIVRLIVFDTHARMDEVPPFPKVLRDVDVAQTQ